MTPNLNRLLGMLEFLRKDPKGCPWTKAQTHESLVPFLIEESYETAESVDRGQTDGDLRDELGDMLLQIALHSQIASERGAFAFDDVAKSIADKVERRYPTIFGNEPNTLKTAAEIDAKWEEVKAQERKAKGMDGPDASALDGLSRALPALLRAHKQKGRMAKTGWDWNDVPELLDKIAEEMGELKAELSKPERDTTRIGDELGDVLFLLADLARWHDVDAEDALRRTCGRIEKRFRHMESALKKKGLTPRTAPWEEQHALWREAKALEKSRG